MYTFIHKIGSVAFEVHFIVKRESYANLNIVYQHELYEPIMIGPEVRIIFLQLLSAILLSQIST